MQSHVQASTKGARFTLYVLGIEIYMDVRLLNLDATVSITELSANGMLVWLADLV